jgi:iron(III) transport system permease protein
MNALESLSIPLIFGQPANIKLFMTYIYEQSFSGLQPNYGLIGAAATILLAIIALLIWLQKRMLGDLRRFNSVTGKASRPRTLPLGALRWPAFAITMVYLVTMVVLPLGAVVLRACVPFLTPLMPIWPLLSLGNFEELWRSSSAMRSITNTVTISLVAAILGTLFTLLVSMVASRSNFRYGRLLEYVALFPRAVPGMIAGVGILYVLLFVPQLGWLRNSIWIVVLAYVARSLPTALGAIAPSMSQISPDLDRAARVIGADWWMSMRIVVLKLVSPALFASFALLFIAFTKEYSTAIFLVAPGSEVLGVSILQAWNQGAAGVASALATVQILLLVTFLFLARHILKVKIYG